ncbi:thioesterase family protein [Ilumatobacter nonamiensis]|uniref:thioesterase family protein n=1 Tax=Ilumatobacter nonamiensis TaxID=467093 RepID=UPI000689041E|nr:thioesterase family protein [Ilumatobacter nonamiensis]
MTAAALPCLFESVPMPADAHPDAVEAWTATEYARGPWDPRHCHGGPVSALLARQCERAPTGDSDWLIARFTIELTRPVPVGSPLTMTTEIERPGRKVSLVAASLWSGGTEIAKVRALRIRHREFALAPHPLAPPELDGVPGEGTHERLAWAIDSEAIAFHSHGSEHRIVEGSWNDAGPVKLWIRLAVDLVPGEAPSGLQRVAAAADFGNGVSSSISYEDYLYINPDLTVHLAREPQGEWIGMSSHSLYGTTSTSSGVGFAESALHDEAGRLGRSVQSLFVDPR